MGNEEKNKEAIIEDGLTELEALACCWIESEYMVREIHRLSEYADEVGEFYEFFDWLKNDPDMYVVSFMGLREHFDLASEIAFDLNRKHEKNLLEKLEKAVMAGEGKLEKYKGINIHDRIKEISDALIEDFEMIYTYSIPDQIVNFYNEIDALLNA